MLITGKGGNRINSKDNTSLFTLTPGYHMDLQALWQGLYQTISRSNGAIKAIKTTTNPTASKDKSFNDVAGHAYFARAWSYFSLVRLWGDIPLWLELPSSGNTNKAKSTAAEVLSLIHI